FFEDVQAMCGDAANKEIEDVLNYLKFVSIREYLSDGKQRKLWVKESKVENLNYKSIEYNK
ncbi:hypothetical protein, partial [Vibrio parahaemolyticus]|uniref:hypothetical protein n=1 Tax=Vibrio parahaemolyticus TaxID=670 RepID=UPI001BAF6379